MKMLQLARYSRAQIKIQQMAFVLVFTMIFFGIVAVIYTSVSLSNLREQVAELRERQALERARQLTGVPEFAFTPISCSSCIDFDKALALKQVRTYQDFWNIKFLRLEVVYPTPIDKDKECSLSVLPPNCGYVDIIPSPSGNIKTKTAFVDLVFWDKNKGAYVKVLGRVHISAFDVER
ncbi:hypothetical protein D6817_02285 [Candidatus Pacearchaeota archaeon]|nr:MAG: hypothetical protein D6817_02285 [Candidatus Pacearchaeota archaeon]